MRHEIEHNQAVIRVYEDGEDVNYIGSAQVRKYGDKGWVSSISSPKGFAYIFSNINEILDELGLTTLEGYMNKSVARAMRIACRGKANYAESHMGECAGREMPWVIISRLKDR